jgi:3-dehydroquinate synthase
MKTIRVNLKNSCHEILIGRGLLSVAGRFLLKKGYAGKAALITNNIVDRLYGDKIARSLEESGFTVTRMIIQDGEQQKSLDSAIHLYKELQKIHADRKTLILAVGGGVIGDLAGFVAATYLRGLPLIHIPTTLLAQFDSSIGGKVAVHLGQVKNVIGTFYNPDMVISDIDTFYSLPAGIVIDGLSEIIKHAVIRDGSFFNYLASNINKIKSLDKEVMEQIVYTSAEIKLSIVKKDEHDYGLRNILNLGHTLGHAVETASDFKVSHGSAVAIGMMGAAKISNRMNLFSGSDLERLEDLLKRAGLPVTLPDLNKDRIMEAIHYDKKIAKGTIRFILPVKIGKVIISDSVPREIIDQVLANWN